MCGNIGDNLIGCDAKSNGRIDRFFGENARDEIWEAGMQFCEECEDFGLQPRVCIGVKTVVGFEDNITAFPGGGFCNF